MDYRIYPVTAGPKHHFFGYYDMRPWDATGRHHLVLEVDFMDRPPTAEDEAAVCAVDLADGNRLIGLARTRAWNFQQGAMLHWDPRRPGTVLFNDRRDGRFVCVAHDVETGRQSVRGPAIAALSEDGRRAATLNFARIAVTRPGYGYEGLDDPFADEAAPAGDGLGLLDLTTGEHRLIVSMASLAPHQPAALGYGRAKVWFNHVLFNPSATRVAFLARWADAAAPGGRRTQMWTVSPDGADLARCLDGPLVSHYDWRDDETLLAWTAVGGERAMYACDHKARRPPAPQFRRAIGQDSHVSYSHDRRWLANDTYPDADGLRELYLVAADTERRVSLGRYHSPRVAGLSEIRCDFHPSWRADDRALAIDGMHEGSRQRYVVELGP